MNRALKALQKDNRGISIIVLFAGGLMLTAVILSAILAYAQIYAGLSNIKNKVKLEMNNTSASAAEIIYGDIGEHNYDGYLESFHKVENNLKADFFSNIKKSMYFETENYTIHPDSLQLNFEAKENYINYKFKCLVDLKINYFGVVFTVKDQEVNITAKHYFKEASVSEGNEDYAYTPSKKPEHGVT